MSSVSFSVPTMRKIGIVCVREKEEKRLMKHQNTDRNSFNLIMVFCLPLSMSPILVLLCSSSKSLQKVKNQQIFVTRLGGFVLTGQSNIMSSIPKCFCYLNNDQI